MSLFVDEDDGMEVDKEEVIRVKEEKLDTNDSILIDSPPVTASSSATNTEVNMDTDHNASEEEEEEEEEGNDERQAGTVPEQDDDPDDPIINEIPIHLNDYIKEQELHLFQYPTKKQSQFINSTNNVNISDTRLKKQSGVVEVKIPLQTGKFFDENKSVKWDNTKDQILKGVIVESKGYYVGIMKEDGLHLNELKKTTQLRPSFKYIDDLKMAKQQKERDLFNRLNNEESEDKSTSSATSSSHVVQMSVKSSGENVPRLGGALQKKKLEEDESYIDYQYFNQSNVEQRDNLVDQTGVTLQCKVSREEYLDSLLQGL